MIPAYTPQELEDFGFSPRDNVADYVDPLEYINIVKASLEKSSLDPRNLNNYTLTELQKVEKSLSQAYTSLSNEDMETYEDNFHQLFTDIIQLQNIKEDEEKKSLEEAASFLNELVDSYDADAPENKARRYLGTAQKDLAAGKFDIYSLAQLQDVENKFKEAYSVITEGVSYQESDFVIPYAETIMGLADLQNERAESGCATDLEITVEEQEISAEEYAEILDFEYWLNDTPEYSMANLPIAPQEEVVLGKYTPKQPYEEEFTLDALLGKGIVSPTASPSFKAYIDPKKKVSEVMEASSLDNVQDIVARYDLFAHLEDLSKIGTSIPASIPEKNLEAVVIPFPAKKKNKVLNHAAKAAFVAVAGLAAVVGYNYLPSWFNFAADEALSHSHEEAAAVTIPITKTRDHIKNRYVKCTDQDTVEKKRDIKPIVIPVTVTAKAPEKKLVEEDIYAQLDVPPEDIYADLESQEDIYAGLDLVGGEDYHLQYHIQPGDTIFGLWKQYAAEGGPIAFTDYLKDVKKENPILKNPDKIWAGEELRFPSLD